MRITLSCLILAVCAFCVSAQSPSKILKQAEKALGGQRALKGVVSRTESGSIRSLADGSEGTYRLQSSRPDLAVESFDIGGFETASGYNGRSGWRLDPRFGLSTLTGAASLVMQAKAIYRSSLWLSAKDSKWKILAGPQTTIDGRLANTVLIVTPKGVSIRISFDASSGLPVREELSSGNVRETVDLGDYREVNGVRFPLSRRMTTAEGSVVEITLSEIRTNVQTARSEFDPPQRDDQPLPDIAKLLAEVQANADRVEELLDKYAYTEKKIDRELGKDGVLREKSSETTQISFYKGYKVERLIEKNGRPLSEKDQAEADKDAAKRVDEIEKLIAKRDARAAKVAATGKPDEDGKRLSVAELFRASRLLNPRRERFRGRDVVVFDFEPNPDFDMKNAKSILKFFGKVAGVMWIDEKDKQVARVEAGLAESYKIGGGLVAKLNKGATFVMENERVGDEIWLPSMAEINLAVRVLLVKGVNLNQLIRYSDYRRFDTEVKDATIDEKKP